MPCFRPLKGYRARVRNPDTGKRSIVFSARQGHYDQPIDLPCGQCIGCRLERSRQWAIRCLHEASLYDSNCFITLTYSNDFLPSNNSLQLNDFQDFMKRLRFHFYPGIRFFHCGEYGEQFARPHYHALIFNLDFADKYPWRRSPSGDQVFRSPTLEKLWPLGQSEIGSVTFESAAYVSRYITKKVTGDEAVAHYEGRTPEYCTMSRRPGIGKPWLDKYGATDVFPSDEVVIRGRQMRPPKYYDRQFELVQPSDYARTKRSRKIQAKYLAALEPWYRLAVREECQVLAFKQLKRGFEDATQSILYL